VVIRKRHLPPGWYPETGRDILDQIEKWESDSLERIPLQSLTGGIIPHAGWFFSGEIAWNVIRHIPDDIELIVVVGGHLQNGAALRVYAEEEYETPLGRIPVEKGLRDLLLDASGMMETQADNTVEIHFPLLAALYPEASVLGLRVAPDQSAVDLGKKLYDYSLQGRRMVVLGSTDLTHYGVQYGYAPSDSKKNPLEWVSEKDHHFLESCLHYKGPAILKSSQENRNACSAGAAACAAVFSELSGSRRAKLLSYSTSYEKQPSDSFVGYGSILYS